MPEKKKDKATLQIIFSSILIAVILLVELYAMINAPGQFIVIRNCGDFIYCMPVCADPGDFTSIGYEKAGGRGALQQSY